jgi:hypothetical protein
VAGVGAAMWLCVRLRGATKTNNTQRRKPNKEN